MECVEFDPSKKAASKGSNNLYVKDFPSSWDDGHLTNVFNKYGPTGSCCIMTDEKTKKNFGFVCYKDAEHAKAAREALHDTKVEGSDETLYVVEAIPK